MNYQKVYEQIINKAKNRQLTCYKEKHHIIPKCLGGSNKKENLVELTAREHFLCHMLLCEIYPLENKLKHALYCMSIGKRSNQSKTYKISSRTYDRIKQEWIKQKVGRATHTKPHSIEAIEKIRLSKIGKKHTEEHKQNISNSSKGKIKTEQHKNNLQKHSNCKSVLQYDLDGNFIKEWFSAKEVWRQTKISYDGISQCCLGNQKSSGGFIWKFK